MYLSALIAAVLQIETFAAFIVGDKCDLINPLLEVLIEEDKCFNVKASLEQGCFMLLVAALFCVGGSQMVSRYAHQAIADRMVATGARRYPQSELNALPQNTQSQGHWRMHERDTHTQKIFRGRRQKHTQTLIPRSYAHRKTSI